MEKRLFIITNPTHYSNIQNYIENKEKAENYIILIIRSFKGDKQLLDLIRKDSRFEILKIIYTSENSRISNYYKLFRNLLKLKLLSSKHPFFDKIFFTNYKSWNQHFVLNQFKSHQKVILSDGAGILLIAEDRKRSKEIPFKAVPFNGNKYILKKLLGIAPVDKLHFYSPFPMEMALGDTLEIFKYKSSKNASVNSNRIFIIGSPLVENGFLSLNKHIEYLQKMQQSFPNFEFSYIAHRRESESNLKEYSFFRHIFRNEIPFEEFLKNEMELPGTIISILSSVLLNLYPVYTQINFYFIELESIDIATDLKFKDNYLILKKKFEEITDPNFSRLDLTSLK